MSLWLSRKGFAGHRRFLALSVPFWLSFQALAVAETRPLAEPSKVAPAALPAQPKSPRTKAAAKHAKAKAPKFDPALPTVTYPGFQLLAAGASQLWLAVSRTVEVRSERKGSQLIFILGGAQVGTANNTNPLITTHFDTPMASARLLPAKDGARLTIWLREDIEPTHRILPGPRGTMLLEVNFPKAKKKYHPRVAQSGPQP